GEDARDQIDAAAGRGGDDEIHMLAAIELFSRLRLRRRRAQRQRKQAQRRDACDSLHAFLPRARYFASAFSSSGKYLPMSDLPPTAATSFSHSAWTRGS